jgi:hypothetical protein
MGVGVLNGRPLVGPALVKRVCEQSRLGGSGRDGNAVTDEASGDAGQDRGLSEDKGANGNTSGNMDGGNGSGDVKANGITFTEWEGEGVARDGAKIWLL